MMQVVGFDMARAAANKVYEAAGIGPDDLDVVELHDCFAHNELITYEGAGPVPGRRRRALHRRWRQHLWRQDRDQSVRRPAVEGPSARRHRAGAMLRADAPAARHGARQRRSMARGSACSTISASAAPASSPSTNAPEARHGRSFRRRARLHAGHRARRARAPAVFPRDARRAQSGLPRRRGGEGGRLCRDAGAADLPVLPGDDGRRTGLRIPRPCSASISRRCCMANSASPTRARRGRRHPDVRAAHRQRHREEGRRDDAGRRRNQGDQPARRPRRGLLPHGGGPEQCEAA